MRSKSVKVWIGVAVLTVGAVLFWEPKFASSQITLKFASPLPER